jgi:flagellar basal-body rod modification protein FlgD
MTVISPVSTASAATVPDAAGAAMLDYNAFLKLLIAQMKNQDPTEPMGNTEFVAQLATFSQVEQSIRANAKLDSLLTSTALSLADAVIGHTVTSPDGSISGVVRSVTITADGPVATLEDDTTLPLTAGVVVS